MKLCHFFQFNAWPGGTWGLSCNSRPPYFGVMCVWIENADWDHQFLVNDPHRLRQIGVVCDDDQLIAVFPKSIDQHVRGNVNVRAFFFHVKHISEARTTGARRGKRHRFFAL
jgi:hypothetical protein